jgi:hypothetical protein
MEEKNVLTCKIHNNKPCNMYCVDDNAYICFECEFMFHKNHNVLSNNVLIKLINEKYNNDFKKGEEEFKRMKKIFRSLKNKINFFFFFIAIFFFIFKKLNNHYY